MENAYHFLWILLLIHLTASQIQKRDDQLDNQIKTYKILDADEDCSVGIKSIRAKCEDLERAICVRNITLKNLVALCAPNISMPGTPASCPVFTFTKPDNTTPPIPIVQPDPWVTCDNCSRFNIKDVNKYPECLILELDTPTTDASNITRNSAGKEEQQDEKKLSGGSIAAIISVVLIMLLVILSLLYKFRCLKKLKERICRYSERIPVRT